MSRLEIPHPDKGHVVLEWEADTMSETEVRKEFRKLIAAGFGAAYEDEAGVEHFTRKWKTNARVIRMLPPLVGG